MRSGNNNNNNNYYYYYNELANEVWQAASCDDTVVHAGDD